MLSMRDIENQTVRYAKERAVMSALVFDLNAALAQLKEVQLPAIRKAIAKFDEAEAELRTALEKSAGLFIEPRTRIFADVRVGYRLG